MTGRWYYVVECAAYVIAAIIFLLMGVGRFPIGEEKRKELYAKVPVLKYKWVLFLAVGILIAMVVMRLFEKVLPAFGVH